MQVTESIRKKEKNLNYFSKSLQILSRRLQSLHRKKVMLNTHGTKTREMKHRITGTKVTKACSNKLDSVS